MPNQPTTLLGGALFQEIHYFTITFGLPFPPEGCYHFNLANEKKFRAEAASLGATRVVASLWHDSAVAEFPAALLPERQRLLRAIHELGNRLLAEQQRRCPRLVLDVGDQVEAAYLARDPDTRERMGAWHGWHGVWTVAHLQEDGVKPPVWAMVASDPAFPLDFVPITGLTVRNTTRAHPNFKVLGAAAAQITPG